MEFCDVKRMTKHLSRLGYCQYLLTSPTNCILSNSAEDIDDMSHDAITVFCAANR